MNRARLWALNSVAFYLVDLTGNGVSLTNIWSFGDGIVTMESMSVVFLNKGCYIACLGISAEECIIE